MAVQALDCIPAKKIVLFCDGGAFFLDRGFLMGANLFNSMIVEMCDDMLEKSVTEPSAVRGTSVRLYGIVK